MFTVIVMCRTYLAQMCEEINDTLQEAGQLTVSDLTKEFGLPTAFLLEVINSRAECVCHHYN